MYTTLEHPNYEALVRVHPWKRELHHIIGIVWALLGYKCKYTRNEFCIVKVVKW